jgi:cell division protein FtsB
MADFDSASTTDEKLRMIYEQVRGFSSKKEKVSHSLSGDDENRRRDNKVLILENNELRSKNKALRREINALRSENNALRSENNAPRREINALRSENNALILENNAPRSPSYVMPSRTSTVDTSGW